MRRSRAEHGPSSTGYSPALPKLKLNGEAVRINDTNCHPAPHSAAAWPGANAAGVKVALGAGANAGGVHQVNDPRSGASLQMAESAMSKKPFLDVGVGEKMAYTVTIEKSSEKAGIQIEYQDDRTANPYPIVLSTTPGSCTDGILLPGDELLTINGEPTGVKLVADMLAPLRRTVELSIMRRTPEYGASGGAEVALGAGANAGGAEVALGMRADVRVVDGGTKQLEEVGLTGLPHLTRSYFAPIRFDSLVL